MTLMIRREFLLGAAALIAAAALPTGAWAQAKPKLGFIGAGRIGSQLAAFWAKAGYSIMLSALDINEVKKLAATLGPNVQAGTSAEAATYGDVVVVTVPYGALPQVGKDYAAELKGKIVLDTCNPNPTRDGDMTKDAFARGTGVMDPIYLPGTRLVRAFNTVGFGALTPSANKEGEKVGIPIAGDDKAAVAVVVQMVKDAGFEPVVVGGLATAKSFDAGTPNYGKAVPASQIRATLGVK